MINVKVKRGGMAALKKSLLPKLVTIVCSIVVSLALAEAGLRIFSVGYLGHPTDGHPILHHVQPPNFEFTSFDLAAEFGEHSVMYDENGFRVPYHGFKYNDSLKDIIFLGDSFVEASEVPYEQIFVSLFAKQFPEYNARNFGVSSYSPLISYLQLKYFMNTIDPVMIVHLLFDNDIEDDQRYYNLSEGEDGNVTAVPGEPNDTVHELLRRSYVARLFNRARLTIQALARGGVTGDEEGRAYYLDDPDLGQVTPKYLTKISQLAEAKGIRYVLMCVPSKIKFNEKQEHKDLCRKIKHFSEKSGFEYLDLDDFFSNNLNDQNPFYGRNIHFNKLGHYLTYLALLDYLKSHPLGAQ